MEIDDEIIDYKIGSQNQSKLNIISYMKFDEKNSDSFK